MKKNLDNVLDKIRKLLALAGNNPNQYEAISAAEMASKLLAEYNLSLTDVELKQIVTKEVIFEELKIATWIQILASIISRVFDCDVYSSRFSVSGGKYKIVFVGNKSDAEVAYYVYDYLYRAIGNLIDKKVKENTSSIHGNTIRKDYSLGIISILEKRLIDFYGKEKEKNDIKTNEYGKTSKELMVIKQDAIAKWLAENVGKINTKKVSGMSRNKSVYESGMDDGEKISLTHGISHNAKETPVYIGG
jgi:hypothetical protein